MSASASGAAAAAAAAATTDPTMDGSAGLGRDLGELLREHADAIAALRTACTADIGADGGERTAEARAAAGAEAGMERSAAAHPPSWWCQATEWDDVWLLRYVLSFGGATGEAVAAVRTCARWRRENAAAITHTLDCEEVDIEGAAEVLRFVKAGTLGVTHSGGGPVFVIRPGRGNIHRLLVDVPREMFIRWQLLLRARMYHMIDQTTREQRRIVKVVIVSDVNGFHTRNRPSRKFLAIFGDISRLSESYFPQLLYRGCLLNAPSFFQTLFALAKTILPRRITAKLRVCGGRGTDKLPRDALARCPFVREMFGRDAAERLPVFLGGTGPCPAHLLTAS